MYEKNKKHNSKTKHKTYEKIGFYTALSICVIAIGMAVFSTYTTVLSAKTNTLSQIETTTYVQQVNENVSGIVETESTNNYSTPEIYSTYNSDSNIITPSNSTNEVTEFSTKETEISNQTQNPNSNSKTALQTMLSTEISLKYPLNQRKIIREYSEKTVYFKTLNTWKSHLGIDFAGDIGEDVVAMSGGAVTKVYDDKLFGKTVEISNGNTVVIYSGLNNILVKNGDTITTGEKIGVVGAVPFEVDQENHIHISVKIDGEYADPLSFIGNIE